MKNGTNRYFFNSTVSCITKFLPSNDEKSLSLSPDIELNYKVGIHLIPKWRPINYFGCMFISRLPHFNFKILLRFIHVDEAKRASFCHPKERKRVDKHRLFTFSLSFNIFLHMQESKAQLFPTPLL